VRADQIYRAGAPGVGNPVLYVGNKTGRDGIHGATMASATFDEHAQERRTTVQVGDPFTEKLLLEACLEAMRTGAIVGIQDMGAAGLACCTSEMPGRSGTGMEVDLDRVPQRETGMSAYEILLSESQERMLLVAERGREDEVRAVFAKWELDAVQIGRVIPGHRLVVRKDGAVVALVELLGSPALASKEWAYRQYDQQVGINTLVLPGSDAAVLRVKGTRRALAVSTDGNARQVFLDPRRGAAMAVAEAARNVACSGGRPLGVTDCLNFGSPERPEILEAVEGIAEACRALEIPVTGGNVSFYNETEGQAILPTPVIGVVGLLEDGERVGTQWFKAPGHRIALLGPDDVSLGGSEYLWTRHRRLEGALAPLDLGLERRVQAAVQGAVESALVTAAHDCSEGGLAVALGKAAVTGPEAIGCDVMLGPGRRADLALFGEGPSRVVVSVEPGRALEFEALMAEAAIPWRWIGTTGGDRVTLRLGERSVASVPLEPLREAWRNGFERHMA
jgi:phosphoribosylformylglycinamidine synthase